MLLFVFMSLLMITKSQELPIDSSTNKVSYSEVVKVDGTSKDELYTRAREWFSMAFKDAKSVLDMDDKAAGKLIGKGNSTGTFNILGTRFTLRIHYTISVTTKDGRYRYEITDFTTSEDGTTNKFTMEEVNTRDTKFRKENGEFKGRYKDYAETLVKATTTLSESLKAKMSGVSNSNKKDNF